MSGRSFEFEVSLLIVMGGGGGRGTAAQRIRAIICFVTGIVSVFDYDGYSALTRLSTTWSLKVFDGQSELSLIFYRPLVVCTYPKQSYEINPFST